MAHILTEDARKLCALLVSLDTADGRSRLNAEENEIMDEIAEGIEQAVPGFYHEARLNHNAAVIAKAGR